MIAHFFCDRGVPGRWHPPICSDERIQLLELAAEAVPVVILDVLFDVVDGVVKRVLDVGTITDRQRRPFKGGGDDRVGGRRGTRNSERSSVIVEQTPFAALGIIFGERRAAASGRNEAGRIYHGRDFFAAA